MIRLPPMAALRAFESAARHLNYTKAAKELHVTQSAISHQIKHIEQLWGFKLFTRSGRSIELTEKAAKLVPIVEDFFSQLSSTLSSIDAIHDEGYLKLTLSQSFALKWMVPRLGEFSHQNPDIDVTIITMPSPGKLEINDADIAIFYSDGKHDNYTVIPLLNGYSFPVCSPEFFANDIRKLQKPVDLLDLPLLRRLNIDAAPRWRDWFTAAGVSDYTLPKGLHFPNSSMALQASIDGQGIALARSSHVADDLIAGRLIKLFNIYVQGESCYNLIIPEGKMDQPSVQKFIAWLKDEAVESQELFDQQARAPGRTK